MAETDRRLREYGGDRRPVRASVWAGGGASPWYSPIWAGGDEARPARRRDHGSPVVFGSTGLSVSPVCFGTWQLSPRFWGDQPRAEIRGRCAPRSTVG